MKQKSTGLYVVGFFFCILSVFVLYSAGWAAENAHYKLPSPNGCYVNPKEMPKFLAVRKAKNRHGIERGITEGFIIRQSYIKEGKIVIPKGGLMYFLAGGEYFSDLNSEPSVLAGKATIWLDRREAMVVKKDFFVPYKKRPVPLGEEGTIALTHTYYNDRYFGVCRGTIKYVFSNGDAGWDSKIMLPQDGLGKSQSSVAYGYVKGEGMISPPPLQYFGDPYSASSSYYVVADELGPKGVHIKEAGAPEIMWFKATYDKPIIADDVAAGQTLAVANYQVKVLSIDTAMGTAQVAVLDSKGATLAEKVLGPLTLETYKVKNLVNHSLEIRRSLVLDYGKIRIQLNTKYDAPFEPGPQRLLNENGTFVPVAQATEVSTFHGGTVDLVLYTNVEQMEMRRPWREDPRFVFITNYI